MHQWLEKKIAPAVKPRQIRLRNDSMPRTFRGEHPELYPQDFAEELKKFKPRSVWAEYKLLLAIFLVVLVSLAVLFVNAVRTAPPKPALHRTTEQPSVYVEMLPTGDAPGPQRKPPPEVR